MFCLLFQINTNGFVSTVEPEAEEEYLGKMPSDFKMIAPLLGDLEDSDGQGRVLFRWDSSPEVLNKSAEHIRRAFPRDEGVDPINVFIVTWENMAARGTSGRGDRLDTKVRGSGRVLYLLLVHLLNMSETFKKKKNL